MLKKHPPKYCHECRHYLVPDQPDKDPVCGHAAELKALADYPILQTVKFQRSSGLVVDCGPSAAFWEPALNSTSAEGNQ